MAQVNIYLLLAGVLLILLALGHSVLGEHLIFKQLNRGADGHSQAIQLLAQRRWDALRSTWHLVSLLAFGLGAVLLVGASLDSATSKLSHILTAISLTFAVSTIFWLIGTRGKHPAWIVLAMITALTYLGGTAG
jgi:hypothetical protein